MRGIIIEKKWHSAIVMTNNGQFRRLYFPFGREVADEVVLQQRPRMQFAVAAMAVFFLVAGIVGYNTRFQTVAYGFVSIEVNPAAEFQINKYGVVVEAVALNGEADEILSEISFRWRSIEKVAADYVGQALAAGFIERPDEARILVTISGIEGTDTEDLKRRLAAIETAQKTRLEQMAVTAVTDYRQVTPAVRQEAATLGVATGTWERIQQGEEMAYTYFDLEIESSNDDKLEIEYRQEAHSFEAEVEWEQRGTQWEREGARALEYLLPILRRLELAPHMGREEIIRRVVTAFEWSADVNEFDLTVLLTDGSRISFEWDRSDATAQDREPVPVIDDADMDDNDRDIDDNRNVDVNDDESDDDDYDDESDDDDDDDDDRDDVDLDDDRDDDRDVDDSNDDRDNADDERNDVDDDRDVDNDLDDDDYVRDERANEVRERSTTTSAAPVIVYIDLEIEGSNDDELEVEYQARTGGWTSADVEFEQNDRTIVDLEGQAAVDYLLPRITRMNLQPGMNRRQVIDRVMSAFGWQGGIEEFEIEVVFDSGDRIVF